MVFVGLSALPARPRAHDHRFGSMFVASCFGARPIGGAAADASLHLQRDPGAQGLARPAMEDLMQRGAVRPATCDLVIATTASGSDGVV